MQHLRAHFNRFLPNMSIAHATALRPYVGLIAFSATSLAIGLGIALRNHLVFEYHDNSGVVGWVSVNQYPKQQEFFYYLLALLGIPTVICLYWVGWRIYSRWTAKLTAQPLLHVLKANALASIPLWLCWLQVYHMNRDGLIWLFLPLGLSTLVKLGLLYNRFLPTLWTAEVPVDKRANMSQQAESPQQPSPQFRLWRAGFEYILFPVFIYLLMYSGNVHHGIDLFHEGERLAPLNEMQHGGIPFRDVYIQHGLFQNAYLAWSGSKFFEPTLLGVRSMENILAPLGYVALYLLGLQVFRGRFLTAFICVLIAAGANFSVSARHSLGLLSFAFVANYLTYHRNNGLFAGWQRNALDKATSSRSRIFRFLTFGWKLIFAGLFTSLAFWYSTEIGLYTLGAIGFFLLIYSLQSGIPLRIRPLPFIGYSCGLLLGFLPVGIYFLAHGALADVIWNSYIQCRYQLATWGLAFPSLSETLSLLSTKGWRAFIFSNGFRWYLPIGIFLLVAAYLTYRRLCGTYSDGAMKLLLLLLGGIAFFRTALGRSDGGHLHYGSTFLWLLCLFPLDRGISGMLGKLFGGSSAVGFRARLSSLSDKARWHRVLKAAWIFIPTGIFFWYVNAVHQPLIGFGEKWERLRQNPLPSYKERIVSEELARAGRVDIPDAQVQQIQKVVAYIQANTSPGEKIFDFTSQGAYYFFANRPSVTRFHQGSYASTPAMQREVIAALERDQTRLVLFKTGGWFDAVDGIPVEERHPLIAEYLQDTYELAIDINNTQILLRK